jgi:pimeloyl-ACP methyl ester carboxylesterase
MGDDSRSARQGGLVLVMAHGAGSTADFVTRAFPGSACGIPVRALEDRTGDVGKITTALNAAVTEALTEAAADAAPAGVLLGGVSIGAHAAALACLTADGRRVAGCVLVMPAWTGCPDAHSPTALAAEEVAQHGAEQVLRRLDDDPDLRNDWVTEELRLSWRDRPTLGEELEAAACGQAPTLEQLRSIPVPVLLLGLAEDPFHPLSVARTWAQQVPDAELTILCRQAARLDRAVFGRQVGRWLRRRFSAPL